MKKLLCLLLLGSLFSCNKIDHWLDVKARNSDVLLSTIEDYQSLLDNTNNMNTTPALGMITADNIALLENLALNSGNVSERNAYIWKADIYEGLTGAGTNDWNRPFTAIAYANIAMEGILKNGETGSQRDNVLGSALFFRAFHYYQLLQLYAPPYQKDQDAPSNLPLRLSFEVDSEGKAVTVQECYAQIIDDLERSLDLLPKVPEQRTRPSIPAVIALLAKAYLDMQDYEEALRYADMFLQEEDSLLDFNGLNAAAALPFPNMAAGHPEVIFYASPISYTFLTLANLLPEQSLYDSFSDNDLRKLVFFRDNANGTRSFKGRYTGTASNFSGLAVNEILMIRLECMVRTGNWTDAMTELDDFCAFRYSGFVPTAVPDEEAALERILEERRKELIFTGSCRWSDLRRLNQDVRFAKTLTRTLAGTTYTLPPGDPRYTLPLIPRELEMNEQ